jgi:1A family penicillin-binding protein
MAKKTKKVKKASKKSKKVDSLKKRAKKKEAKKTKKSKDTDLKRPKKKNKLRLRKTLAFKKIKLIFKRLKINKKKILLLSLVPMTGLAVWIFWGIPLPNNLSSEQYPVSTKIFDRNGNTIYEIYAEKRRTPVKLEDLPEHVKQATISIEDKDFYKHHGFSLKGITRAFYNIVFKGKIQGGSTLTQQLVKNTLLTPERTLKRKIREFVLSMVVEFMYSKDQILEMYLNQIPYGSTAYGIEAASELYFAKSAKDLTLAEATLLAGLPAAPTRYSPFGVDPERAQIRQETVLRRMAEEGYISQDEVNKVKEEELKYAQMQVPRASHFALWIKEQLADKYGDAVVEQGGLRVTTTLDLELQEFAEEIIADEVDSLKDYNVGNGAALVTIPKTGEVLAMVGSKNYFAEDEDGKYNIILSQRQPGSSIKPLNYALAIKENKLTPSTVLADVPTCFAVAGQKDYCPSNYDRSFHGAVQARFALGNSYNIPAVRVLALNGLENFIEFAREMGITTFTDPSNYGLSITLGGGEVKPYDMAVAFGVLANQGVKQELVSIQKIEDWKGTVLEENKLNEAEENRIIPEEVAFIVSHILLDNNARSAAFGGGSYLNVRGHPEVSVKTGTTNDRRDNWTIGYTHQILVLTWVGNNDNSSMSSAVSGVSGASPIWNKIIKEALDKSESGKYDPDNEGHSWPIKPPGVVGSLVCADTGSLPTGPEGDPGCPTRFEYYLESNLPPQIEQRNQDIQIDKTLGSIITPDTPPENVETQNHPVVIDPHGTIICLDCPIAVSPIRVNYPSLNQNNSQP